jgi:hypothetical protein
MPELTDVEILADGLSLPQVEVVARVGGGPNGAARGPDGASYGLRLTFHQ